MPNIMTALKAEIVRLARKEVKAKLAGMAGPNRRRSSGRAGQ